MDSNGGTPREVALPVTVLASLRSEIEKESGTLGAVHALHGAGYKAGAHVAAVFSREHGASLGEKAFWQELSDFFEERGWGTMSHEAPHRAVGVLRSVDWAEVAIDGEDADGEPSCHFSTGLLSGLLSTLAGGPVAVLEIACRGRGSEACQFAFGSEAAIHDLYGRLLDGAELDGALAAL